MTVKAEEETITQMVIKQPFLWSSLKPKAVDNR